MATISPGKYMSSARFAGGDPYTYEVMNEADAPVIKVTDLNTKKIVVLDPAKITPQSKNKTAYDAIIGQIASGTLKTTAQRFRARQMALEKGEEPVSNVQPEDRLGTSIQPVDRLGTSLQPEDRLGTSEQPVDRLGTSEQPVERLGTSEQPVERLGTSMQPEDLFGESSMEELNEDEKEKKKLIDAIMKLSSRTSSAKPSASTKK